ncbi:MAG TPA: alpha-1,4-glucan--maltose-1-phosphate maltosyltransferase [Candidatus Eremiobacteraceae bacterium]|nr:alpha-1,4-glucan--maltose-1-phosphate maltosyltransferase [Candidatus Eremiobacteraceae bacterium]
MRTLHRVIIEGVSPELDAGRFAIKRIVGDELSVRADIYADGHDSLGARLLWRHEDERTWNEAPLRLDNNDRWEGKFKLEKLGRYLYTVVAWADAFGSWSKDLKKRADAGQDISVDVLIGAEIVRGASERARGADAKKLGDAAAKLKDVAKKDRDGALAISQNAELALLVNTCRDRSVDTRYERELAVVVDPEKARFSTWYELFPRSVTTDPKRHGTFRDVIDRLPYVAGMGFDILYMPPIHPIGRSERKGKNNSTTPAVDDTGSPWAIGAEEGGHKAIHLQLGTLDEFKVLVTKARELGIDIALDIAFQCAPDHPYVKEHREWFRERPDGTVQYAENPPKKYQDIYPFHFEGAGSRELWAELKSVVDYWIAQGVRVFRVDNPHTKPFAFWEWLIGEVKKEHPEVIFLSEAFTRPKVMYQLAKLGFTQSYTYFAWKNSSTELTEYFDEMMEAGVFEYFRPNLWPNTPDILNEYLQRSGRAGFMTRLILAGTLSGSYGIYGPAYELCEGRPVREGSEEYLDSEKYQIRVWDINNPNSLRDLITHVNRIRKNSRALQQNLGLAFHPVENSQLIAYSKVAADKSDMILVVANLDPHNRQAGWVNVDVKALGLGSEESYQVHDLLTDARYVWHGSRNFVDLNPFVLPAHIFQVHSIG